MLILDSGLGAPSGSGAAVAAGPCCLLASIPFRNLLGVGFDPHSANKAAGGFSHQDSELAAKVRAAEMSQFGHGCDGPIAVWFAPNGFAQERETPGDLSPCRPAFTGLRSKSKPKSTWHTVGRTAA